MKQIRPQIQETLAPNLIPMIDIMFLLLLFFMLGADMGQRELEDVRLPRADAATPEGHPQKDDRVTINAHHRTDLACAGYSRSVCRDEAHWKIAIKGRDCTDPAVLATVLEGEAAPFRHPDAQGRSVSDRRVMIRADRSAPYGLAQRAIAACAERGIYKVEVGAAKVPAR